MKKEIVLSLRVDEEMHKLIHSEAQKDERTLAWMARKLLEEALLSRGHKLKK